MKILIIGSDRNLFKENSEVRSRFADYGKLAEEIRVVVFSRQSDGLAPTDISENVRAYPTNSPSRWCYPLDAFRTAKKIVAESPGRRLISCQDPFEAGLAGWLLKRKSGFPLQLQIHTDFLSSRFAEISVLNKIRVLIAKFLLPKADCVRVVSERIKNSLSSSRSKIQNPKFKIAVLPIFVDAAAISGAPVKTDLRRKYPQFDFIILMLSRLSREKNICLAIGAFAAVAKEYPRTGLIIAGDGPEREALKSKIMKKGLEKNVIMENWADDAVSYYKTADLFLLTSDYEGYGRSVVEAMAAGCPVLMTDVGVAGEIVRDGENGLVVPVGDGEKTEEALLKIVGDKTLRENLAEKAKSAAGALTKEKYLEEYRKLWELCERSYEIRLRKIF